MSCHATFRRLLALDSNPCLVRFYSRARTPKRPTKKILVQLLKDWDGLGSKGEIVRVAPGRMRNELHRFNGAAYVLPGVESRIPIKTHEEVMAEKLAVKELLQNAEKKKEQQLQNQQISEHESTVTVDDLARIANLSFLSRTENQSISTQSSEYLLRTAVESLPVRINLRRPVQTTGFLKEQLTAPEVAAFTSTLAGASIPSSIISFKVGVEGGKEVDSAFIDHIGNYPAIFKVGDSIISRRIIVQASNYLDRDLPSRRPAVPLPEIETKPEVNVTQQAQANSESTQSDKSTSTKAGSKESFEWENEFIQKAEKL